MDERGDRAAGFVHVGGRQRERDRAIGDGGLGDLGGDALGGPLEAGITGGANDDRFPDVVACPVVLGARVAEPYEEETVDQPSSSESPASSA